MLGRVDSISDTLTNPVCKNVHTRPRNGLRAIVVVLAARLAG